LCVMPTDCKTKINDKLKPLNITFVDMINKIRQKKMFSET